MLSINPSGVMRNDFYLKPIFQIQDRAFGGGLDSINNTGFGGGLGIKDAIKPPVMPVNNDPINMVKDNIPLILIGIALTILLK